MTYHTQTGQGCRRPQRIAVVGSTGAGKTTLARELSRILNLPHIELDALHWDPNWTPCPTEEFRRRVDAALSNRSWVTDGSYGKVRDLIWPRADVLIWLDYPLPFLLYRLLLRIIQRIYEREELWNGNRESLRLHLSRDGLLWWAIRTHHKKRREYSELIQQPEYAHLTVLRHRNPKATQAWLSQFMAEVPASHPMEEQARP